MEFLTSYFLNIIHLQALFHCSTEECSRTKGGGGGDLVIVTSSAPSVARLPDRELASDPVHLLYLPSLQWRIPDTLATAPLQEDRWGIVAGFHGLAVPTSRSRSACGSLLSLRQPVAASCVLEAESSSSCRLVMTVTILQRGAFPFMSSQFTSPFFPPSFSPSQPLILSFPPSHLLPGLPSSCWWCSWLPTPTWWSWIPSSWWTFWLPSPCWWSCWIPSPSWRLVHPPCFTHYST